MCRSEWKMMPAVLLAVLLLGAGGWGSLPVTRAADDERRNTLTEKERGAGWKLLFDGVSTKGWRKFKGKSVPDKWHVEKGTLTFLPKGGKQGGDIVTEDQYDNFELAIDWKIAPGGNSGIMYRVSEKADFPWVTGPEYQICDNAKHSDGKNPKTSAASCYALYPPSKDVTHKAGEWNKTRLIVNGNHVEHWLNGTKVAEYELGSEDWNKRVKDSKFKDMAHFGKEKKGYICLQDHGDRVEFRNIKIRVLDGKGK
jgi:Domain of Unknown Function (DUF1080)